MKSKFKNLILISGSGRNMGKTTLGCRLIEQMSEKSVTGIKISPHFHEFDRSDVIAGDETNWVILEERNRHTGKDSSRFLAAGAAKVYYIQVRDDSFLNEVISWMKVNIPSETPVVCESGGLGKFIIPGKAYFVTGDNPTKECNWDFPYETIRVFDND